MVAHIANVRFGQRPPCPRCRSRAHLFLRPTRRKLACSQCSFEVSVTSRTLFDRSKIPLTTWFYLMMTMSNSSQALSVSFVERHFGLSRMAAFGALSRIRLHLGALQAGAMLGGMGQILQVDETWVRQVKNPASKKGYGAIVLGIYSRSGVITKVIPNRTSKVLIGELLANTHSSSIFVTDQLQSYSPLSRLGFKHIRLNHSIGEWVNRDGYSSIGIEGYWGNLKYYLQSANLAPSIDYFSGYLAEHAFRYNCRKMGKCAFQEMISKFPLINKIQLPKAVSFSKSDTNLASGNQFELAELLKNGPTKSSFFGT